MGAGVDVLVVVAHFGGGYEGYVLRGVVTCVGIAWLGYFRRVY